MRLARGVLWASALTVYGCIAIALVLVATGALNAPAGESAVDAPPAWLAVLLLGAQVTVVLFAVFGARSAEKRGPDA